MSGPAPERSAIVTGATGLVGQYLLPMLLAEGFSLQAVSRRAPRDERRIVWHEIDLSDRPRPPGPGARPMPPDAGRDGSASPNPPPLARADVLFHAAPLWLLPPWLPTFANVGVRRLVAFSSTSRLTKESSGHPREREVALRLADAEAAVAQFGDREGIRWTIFRPTLIYGGGRDRNVTDIARIIRWFGLFPIAGEGRGRRQPVHASDLARSCLLALDRPTTFGRIYELPGGETLRYREMVLRVAQGLGRRPRLLRVPRGLLRATLGLARRLPGFGHLTPEMAARMDEDMVFDSAPARRDFGYDPRPFRSADGPR